MRKGGEVYSYFFRIGRGTHWACNFPTTLCVFQGATGTTQVVLRLQSHTFRDGGIERSQKRVSSVQATQFAMDLTRVRRWGS